jgi:hypothetical protein
VRRVGRVVDVGHYVHVTWGSYTASFSPHTLRPATAAEKADR